MKTVDYINSLIDDKERLKAICESHEETIHLLKIALRKHNVEDSIKNEIINNNDNELNKLKLDYANLKSKYDAIVKKNETLKQTNKEFTKLKSQYNALKCKYDDVVKQNKELISFLDEIDIECDSD
jgi:chromosome segregation ATPase